MGSPQKIASQIKAEYAIRDFEEGPPATTKKGMNTLWVVLIAIFAAPVAFPLAIAIAAVVFSLLVALFAVVFSLIVAAIAIIVSGIIVAIVGVKFIAVSGAIMAMLIGAGLILLGIGVLGATGVVALGKACFNGIVKLSGKALPRREQNA